MAYPLGTLSLKLEDIDRRVDSLKQQVDIWIAALASNVGSDRVINMFEVMHREHAFLTTASSIPGLGPFTQTQKDDGGLDVVAEFTTLLALMVAVTDWIDTNFPVDGGGFLLSHTLGATTLEERQFTPAQTAGLLTALTNVTNQITA